MNTVTNQFKQTVPAIGSDNSPARLKQIYCITLPKLVKALRGNEDFSLAEICKKDGITDMDVIRNLIFSAAFYRNDFDNF